MSRNIVFEGWLTKSPPTKRIWRTKWRRRWFALRHSGELPGQYFLDYYADRNYRRLKGTINLDLCEQVDAGLHMERSGNGTIDPKLRGSVFTIQTQSRIYHLEADCEADMLKWVTAICQACGLRSTEDTPGDTVTYKTSETNVNVEIGDSTGPYIPISECITGVKNQKIAVKSRSPLEAVSENNSRQVYLRPPQIKITSPDASDAESTQSDEEKSLLASQMEGRGRGAIPKTTRKLEDRTKRNWSATKSFPSSERNGAYENGPPVPPRPPKTLSMNHELHELEFYRNPKFMDTADAEDAASNKQYLSVPSRRSHAAPSSPTRHRQTLGVRIIHEEDENNTPGNLSMQYYNLASFPPAVDRALKPRPTSHSLGNIDTLGGQEGWIVISDSQKTAVKRSEVLQYLDLDLHTTESSSSQPIIHGRSASGGDPDPAYKTVDFLKTEAFNITRQDAEASRSSQH